METLSTVNGHIAHVRREGKFLVGTIMCKAPEQEKPLRSEVWLGNGQASAFNPTEWDLVMGGDNE